MRQRNSASDASVMPERFKSALPCEKSSELRDAREKYGDGVRARWGPPSQEPHRPCKNRELWP